LSEDKLGIGTWVTCSGSVIVVLDLFNTKLFLLSSSSKIELKLLFEEAPISCVALGTS